MKSQTRAIIITALDRHVSVRQNKLMSPFALLIPLILVLAVSGVITEMFSATSILGQWLGVLGCVLLLAYMPSVVAVLDHSRIRCAFLFLLVLVSFMCVHSSSSMHDMKDLILSCGLYVLLSVTLAQKGRVKLFSLFMLVPLVLVTVSPGITKIFTFSRSFGSMHREAEDVLIGLSGHYINYSVRCVMTFFLGTGFCLISKHWIKKVFFGAIVVTAFVGCMTSGSRGSVIALLCGSVFLILASRKNICGQILIKRKYIVLCIAALICFIPWKSVSDCFLRNYHATGTLGNRWYLYMQGMEIFRDHPMIGIGWGGFRAMTTEPQHSNWLRTFVELGILGGIGEIVLWLMFFRLALVARKISERIMDRDLAILITVWTSVMFSFCVWQAYENMGLLTGTRLYYICFGVVSAAYLSAKIRANRMNAIPHPNYFPQTK